MGPAFINLLLGVLEPIINKLLLALEPIFKKWIKEILAEFQVKQFDSGESVEKLLTIQEAAEFLNLKVSTLYSKVSKGTIPVMKRSKRLYFSSTQLMEYLKEGQKRTYAEIEKEAQSYLNSKK